ncbi:type I methionyl aminopeptidase [Anaerophaga thermohalophila]|jgi:methionyl aminopeptidase|uniref:type I methionyl aminopeptidase n=1 Tax=Anaerophaga thermohalophila TaxID=177400 RepID=UPI00031C9249|nr:type I methionyl aminopeptidase [Anaerophaga thermohalophila]
MIYLKTKEEIELLRESNMLVAKTHGEIARMIEPGVTTLKLDKVAEEFIRDHGGVPAFLNYQGFPNSLCTSVNDQVVHGIPNDTPLKDGDIVSVDCGVLLNGFYGDSAYTFCVGNVDEEIRTLLDVTKTSLYKGIEQAVEGKRVGDIGYAVQSYAEKYGFSVVREMVGHGVGKNLHESPEVPNYGRRGNGVKLKEGMVIAIEPMINFGKRHIVQEADGWTIRTKDRKVSAHFEHTVAVGKNEADILSSFKFVEEVLHLQSEK